MRAGPHSIHLYFDDPAKCGMILGRMLSLQADQGFGGNKIKVYDLAMQMVEDEKTPVWSYRYNSQAKESWAFFEPDKDVIRNIMRMEAEDSVKDNTRRLEFEVMWDKMHCDGTVNKYNMPDCSNYT